MDFELTGYSAPYSELSSLNTSGTSSSSITADVWPMKVLRNNLVLATAATSSNAMSNIAEQAAMIQSSSSSDNVSVVSSTTLGQRLALAKAKQ